MTATCPPPGANRTSGCGHDGADHRAHIRDLLAEREPELAALLTAVSDSPASHKSRGTHRWTAGRGLNDMGAVK